MQQSYSLVTGGTLSCLCWEIEVCGPQDLELEEQRLLILIMVAVPLEDGEPPLVLFICDARPYGSPRPSHNFSSSEKRILLNHHPWTH